MTVLEETGTGDGEQSSGIIADGMFSHPDHTAEIDARSDPVTEIADTVFPLGPVIKGRGLENGTFVEFVGLRFPNILAPSQMCAGDVYMAVSFEAQQILFRDTEKFSSKLFEESVKAFWGPALTPMNPPEHTTYRAVMQQAFMPKLMKIYEETIVQPVLKRRFDELKPRGRADLARELNAFYPYEIVGTIVGYETGDVEFIASLFATIFQANTDPMAAVNAGTELRKYTQQLVEKRRKEPREDVVSAIINEEVDGEPIPDERLVGMINHLMAGGVDTTYRQTSNTVHCLLSHPDQLEKLRADHSLIPSAVNEALRFEGIGGILPRMAAKDTDLCGTQIPKGAVVFGMQGVGNRDPKRWDNPHTFDIERKPKPHLQFIFGPHACLGQHLARLMISRYLEHLLNDLSGLRWDPEADIPPSITGWSQRAALSLPVVWDAP